MSLLIKEQYFMKRLQVYNWGTFSGLHSVDIAKKGFLFIGYSGSGKTTLLDAIAALLTPPGRVDFNAAAREAEKSGRDRNFASYIRGAWAEQEESESREIATRYLRPGPTWSALALTYQDESGNYVSLAEILWLQANQNTSPQRRYLILNRDFSLKELDGWFSPNVNDVRKLKAVFAKDFIDEYFNAYSERFRRIFGIESENALRLLNKTQSAKNLGDLNTFLRDFMLDKPETFDAATRLVDEFGELNGAHIAVVKAREQVAVLIPARKGYEERSALIRKRQKLDSVRAGIDHYKNRKEMELLAEDIKGLEITVLGQKAEEEKAKALYNTMQSDLLDLRMQKQSIGGNRIENWENEVKQLAALRNTQLGKKGQAENACKTLGWPLPGTVFAFAELTGKARNILDSAQDAAQNNQTKLFDIQNKKKEAGDKFKELATEIEAMKKRPSNIPSAMQNLRNEIAAAIGVHENALPFAGELLEVKKDEASVWQGAIERALHGLSLSLLVEEKYYSALSNYINNNHLGKRLVYYRISGAPHYITDKKVNNDALFFKMNIKDGVFRAWLEGELKTHYNYTCTQSMQAFKNEDYAITDKGLMKQGKTRHEKDDRYKIDDRANWVLGFDNAEKRMLFEKQAQELALVISNLSKEITVLEDAQKKQNAEALACQTLVNINWQEIDVAGTLSRIEELNSFIKKEKEGNAELKKIDERIKEQEARVEKADKARIDAGSSLGMTETKLHEQQARYDTLKNDTSFIEPSPEQREELDARFSRAGKLTLSNLSERTRKVSEELFTELGHIEKNITRCEDDIKD
jgi:uncharacterized protein YPO0396